MRIGVDVGGTKIEILVLDINGTEVLRKRLPTPSNNYHAILKVITDLINESQHTVADECSVGICTPGSISLASGLLRNSNTICLNDKPFKQDLEKLLGKEVRISNDANCFALSEATDGAAQGAYNVFGVIIGTGVGAGIVINGKLLQGKNLIAGEWGHNSLPWPTPEELKLSNCWCGQVGCIETFLSGPGLENCYKRIAKRSERAENIIKIAEKGDEVAEECLIRYEQCMARSLAHVINILDPGVIVLGGGLSNVQRIYKNVPKIWGKWVFSESVNTKLIPSMYGDSSGVRGAAWLWDRD